MSVAFLYPLFLAAAAAVAIPLVLHLLRRRPEGIVDFPAIRLLQNAPVEQRQRRRLRELLLLALRMTALALLALAFARPYLQSATAAVAAPVTVVLIDTSLSLSAPGQFDRARAAAREAVQNAPGSHHVALVTFHDAANVVVPPTTDRGGLFRAIDEIRPTAGGTRYRTALARAAEVIPNAQGAIVVITDLQQAGWEANDDGAVPDGIDVRVVEIPGPLSNLAVTAARREGADVLATVHNYGPQPARAAVRLHAAGRGIVSQTIEVDAQSAADVRFAGPVAGGGAAEVRVNDPEGYEADNARFLSLDPAPALPVLIITAQSPSASNAGLYLERALSVADEGRAFAVRTLDGRAVGSLPLAQLADTAAIFVLGTSSLDRQGRERVASYLKDGGGVLAALGPDVDLATLPDTLGTRVPVDPAPPQVSDRAVTLVAVDTRHPIFRPFVNPSGALGDVHVERYRRLKDEGATVLARFSGAGDALIEQVVGRGRLLVFASDLDNAWNRFPLNAAFVPWAIETTRYLAQGREHRSTFTLPEVPPGVPSEPGVHRVADRPITVNTNVRESNPARATAEAFLADVERVNAPAVARAAVEAREQEERQRLWQIGLLVMLVALALEGVIGRKAL
jgi:hypothetical protein